MSDGFSFSEGYREQKQISANDVAVLALARASVRVHAEAREERCACPCRHCAFSTSQARPPRLHVVASDTLHADLVTCGCSSCSSSRRSDGDAMGIASDCRLRLSFFCGQTMARHIHPGGVDARLVVASPISAPFGESEIAAAGPSWRARAIARRELAQARVTREAFADQVMRGDCEPCGKCRDNLNVRIAALERRLAKLEQRDAMRIADAASTATMRGVHARGRGRGSRLANVEATIGAAAPSDPRQAAADQRWRKVDERERSAKSKKPAKHTTKKARR